MVRLLLSLRLLVALLRFLFVCVLCAVRLLLIARTMIFCEEYGSSALHGVARKGLGLRRRRRRRR